MGGYSASKSDVLRPERLSVARRQMSIEQVLLDWCHNRLNGYKVKFTVNNLFRPTSSWPSSEKGSLCF